MPRDIDLIKISQDTDYRESLEVGQTSYPRLRILSPLPPYSSLPRDLNFIVESSKLSAEQDMSSFNEIEITLFYKKTTTRKNLDKKKKNNNLSNQNEVGTEKRSNDPFEKKYQR